MGKGEVKSLNTTVIRFQSVSLDTLVTLESLKRNSVNAIRLEEQRVG